MLLDIFSPNASKIDRKVFDVQFCVYEFAGNLTPLFDETNECCVLAIYIFLFCAYALCVYSQRWLLRWLNPHIKIFSLYSNTFLPRALEMHCTAGSQHRPFSECVHGYRWDENCIRKQLRVTGDQQEIKTNLFAFLELSYLSTPVYCRPPCRL